MKDKGKLSSDAEVDKFFAEIDRKYDLLDDEDDVEVETESKPETEAEKAVRLEAEIAQGQATLKENFSRELLSELETKSAELKDILRRTEREQRVKETYRQRFAGSFGSESDFERLWESNLRDEALLKDAEQQMEIEEALRHPLYR